MSAEEYRDWPESLKLNFEATRLAPMIYYCRTQIYGGDWKLWDGLSPASKQMYVAIAGQLLQTFRPIPAAPITSTATLRLVDRLKEEPPPPAAADEWCKKCGTREVSKTWAPYCSAICFDAAKRAELMDRR